MWLLPGPPTLTPAFLKLNHTVNPNKSSDEIVQGGILRIRCGEHIEAVILTEGIQP